MWYSPYYLAGPVSSSIYFCEESVNVFFSTHQVVSQSCLLPFQLVPSGTPWAHHHLNEGSVFWAEKWARMLALINCGMITLQSCPSPYYFILPSTVPCCLPHFAVFCVLNLQDAKQVLIFTCLCLIAKWSPQFCSKLRSALNVIAFIFHKMRQQGH